MLNSTNYQRIRNFFDWKELPEVLHLALSIIFVVSKYFQVFDSLGYWNWGFLISITIQISVMIFFKKVKKLMNSKFYLIYAFSTVNYLVIIYYTFHTNLLFLSGMEIMVVIYFNFQKIRNKIFRLTFLGVFAIFFLRKVTDSQVDGGKIAYIAYIMLIFEASINFNLKKKMDNVKKTNSISNSKKFFHDDSSPYINNDKNSLPDKKEILLEFNSSQKLLNLIKVGIVLVNQNFEIIYSNNILSELFETENVEEAKLKFFGLEEKVGLNDNNDFSKIPHRNPQELFIKMMNLSPKTIESNKSPEKTEQTTGKLKKIITEESISIAKQCVESLGSKEDLDSQFKNWKKRKFSDHISGKIFDIDKKKEQAKSVFYYLKKLFDYFNQDDEQSFKKREKKYSMYVNYKSSEDAKDLIILLNFIHITENIDSKSAQEILITVRKLSELEAKFIEESKSKNKMLGSFCHELRTPINGIINMLDLIEIQNEEDKTIYEQINTGFDELLSSAVVSSHLLLNEIDDFIDYFSFCNEIIEAHMNPFDFREFFHEINRVFTFIAKKKKLNFFIEIDKDIPLIICNDQQRLKQILSNLISNFFIIFFYVK